MLLSLSLYGCATKEARDVASLCRLARQHKDTTPEQLAHIMDGFEPLSTPGRVFVSKREESPDEADFPGLLDALEFQDTHEGCAALAAHKRAIQERDTTQVVHEANCKALTTTLDDIATALPPLFEGDIPALIDAHVPENKRAEVKRLFAQELAVKVRAYELAEEERPSPDKVALLSAAGCSAIVKQAPSPDAAQCEEINALIPRITGGRRVVLIGEAYGEALMQSGLDPSDYSARLQERLIVLSKERGIETLAPHVAKLGTLTGCTFE